MCIRLELPLTLETMLTRWTADACVFKVVFCASFECVFKVVFCISFVCVLMCVLCFFCVFSMWCFGCFCVCVFRFLFLVSTRPCAIRPTALRITNLTYIPAITRIDRMQISLQLRPDVTHQMRALRVSLSRSRLPVHSASAPSRPTS